MQIRVPKLHISRGRIIAIFISVSAIIGGLTNLLIPESSPLSISKQETLPYVNSVYLSGEVVYPGVYEINEGEKLVELIDQAGGFTEDADPDFVATEVNLASLVSDEQHIHIPRVEEVTEAEVYESNGLININTASISALTSLSGIGEETAKKIIAARPFKSEQDILAVAGIGESKLAQFRDSIVF